MAVVGFWLPVTQNILFNLVKSVSIVLSGQFFYQSTCHLCGHCNTIVMALVIEEQLLFLKSFLVSKALELHNSKSLLFSWYTI